MTWWQYQALDPDTVTMVTRDMVAENVWDPATAAAFYALPVINVQSTGQNTATAPDLQEDVNFFPINSGAGANYRPYYTNAGAVGIVGFSSQGDSDLIAAMPLAVGVDQSGEYGFVTQATQWPVKTPPPANDGSVFDGVGTVALIALAAYGAAYALDVVGTVSASVDTTVANTTMSLSDAAAYQETTVAAMQDAAASYADAAVASGAVEVPAAVSDLVVSASGDLAAAADPVLSVTVDPVVTNTAGDLVDAAQTAANATQAASDAQAAADAAQAAQINAQAVQDFINQTVQASRDAADQILQQQFDQEAADMAAHQALVDETQQVYANQVAEQAAKSAAEQVISGDTAPAAAADVQAAAEQQAAMQLQADAINQAIADQAAAEQQAAMQLQADAINQAIADQAAAAPGILDKAAAFALSQGKSMLTSSALATGLKLILGNSATVPKIGSSSVLAARTVQAAPLPATSTPVRRLIGTGQGVGAGQGVATPSYTTNAAGQLVPIDQTGQAAQSSGIGTVLLAAAAALMLFRG